MDWIGVTGYVVAAVKAFVLSVLAIPLAGVGMGYYEIVKPAVLGMGFQKTIAFLGAAFGMLAFVGVVISRRLKVSVVRSSLPPMVPFLATVCAVHLGLNSALFPGQWRYAGLVWYFLVEYLFLFLVLGWCFGTALESCSNSLFEKVRFGALALYVVALVPILLWRPSLPTEQELKYIGARWMNQNLPSDAVVAASNAGVTGYFARMPVINLDGLVNDVDFFEH